MWPSWNFWGVHFSFLCQIPLITCKVINFTNFYFNISGPFFIKLQWNFRRHLTCATFNLGDTSNQMGTKQNTKYFKENDQRRINGILLPKLFWPTVRKIVTWSRKTFEIQGWRQRICKMFEITRTIYSNMWKFRTMFGNRMLFQLILGGVSYLIN